jgi:hypothetical protein
LKLKENISYKVFVVNWGNIVDLIDGPVLNKSFDDYRNLPIIFDHEIVKPIRLIVGIKVHFNDSKEKNSYYQLS